MRKNRTNNPTTKKAIAIGLFKKIPIPCSDKSKDCLKASSAFLAKTNAINKAGRLYPVNH